VGALPHILESCAGVEWNPDQPLGPVVREMVSRRDELRQGCRRMCELFSKERYAEHLRGIYREVLRAKGIAPLSIEVAHEPTRVSAVA